MIPVDQTVFGAPGGNCFSACVATLLELPLAQVPYFMGDGPANEPSDWFDDFLRWLAQYDYWAVMFGLRNSWKPDGLCILSGKSPRGDFDHSVVADGLRMVHDPHPSRAGLQGPPKDVVLLIPKTPKRACRWKPTKHA